MDELPSVHRCSRLSGENEQLLKKLKKLRQKNEVLENELSQIQEKLQVQQLMRSYVTTRDPEDSPFLSVQVQTEPRPWHRGGGGDSSKEVWTIKQDDIIKILQMYNTLQKCYEKEIKTNKEQSERIANLTVKSSELECQLQTAKERIQQLEQTPASKQRGSSNQRTPTPDRSSLSCRRRTKSRKSCSCSHSGLLLDIEQLQKEREKLAKERRMLKTELAALDKGFFEEIEDVKYALQESAKLNKQYERYLQQICTVYGLPFSEFLIASDLKKDTLKHF
nr:PREDICTED: centrosomal protein of 290 kDa-like isoform X1 [Latimeria chalumnae]|eukprot:XP_014343967.1 PREDICTED: centrosomal protein of 290 kDa-like isoform X1 [Latimeria chalumnae]